MDGSNVDSSNSSGTFAFSCDQCSASQAYTVSQVQFECIDCSQTVSRNMAIRNFLRDHFAGQFGFPKESISGETVLREVGDSLSIIEMLLRLEKQFGISMNHEDLEDLETLQDVANYLDEMLAKRA